MVQNLMALTVVCGAVVYMIYSIFKKPVRKNVSKCSGCTGCTLKENFHKKTSLNLLVSPVKNQRS